MRKRLVVLLGVLFLSVCALVGFMLAPDTVDAASWYSNFAIGQFTAAQTQYTLVPIPPAGSGGIIVRYIAMSTAGAGEAYLSDDAAHAGGIHVVSPDWELNTSSYLVLPNLNLMLAVGAALYVTSDIAADHNIYVEYEITE